MDKKMRNRYILIVIVYIIIFVIIISKLSTMQLLNTEKNIANLNKISIKKVYGRQMPRGRIYDRNYNVIVDNVGINQLVYKRKDGTTVEDEIKTSYLIAKNLDINTSKLTDRIIREFWVVNNKDKADKKITDEEYDLYEKRKLKMSEIDELKLKKITKKELSKYS